jgi:putative ABC transport system permease protein
MKITAVAVIAVPLSPVTLSQQAGLEFQLNEPVYVERGYHSQYEVAVTAILAAAFAVSLAAGAVATGLSITDSRAEMRAYWAIGAAPGTRRRLAIVRAGILSVTGAIAGTAIGLVPPWVIIELARRNARRVIGPYWAGYTPHPLSIPWFPSLILTLVAVPVTAMALAALTTSPTPSTSA